MGPRVVLAAVCLIACSTQGTGTASDSGPGTFRSFGEDAGSGSNSTGGTCKPRTCTEAGVECGSAGDGCGGTLTCPTCPSGESCGGGGTPSHCGSGTTCRAKTCQQLQANCGPVADGCGTTIDCGTCFTPSVCGGDAPSVCSGTTIAPCTGVCAQETSCPSGTTTSLSGIVHAPTDTTIYGPADPLYDAIVYIPTGTVEPFTPGVTCDRCGAVLSGDPLVQVTTGPDGKFTLDNVPSGSNIPLVVQLGRWRRQITIPTVTPCVNNVLSDEQVRMPRTSAEGDIPKIAMATGSADPLECVLRKIGIDDSEFTLPSGSGRVSFYTGNGASLSTGTTNQSKLTSSLSTLEQYDMVIFACWGEEDTEPAADLQNLVTYADNGGRVFATHYSYVWLYQNSPFDTTATWGQCTIGGALPPNQGGGDTCNENDGTLTATVDQSFTRGQAFAEWLLGVGASSALGQVPIESARFNFKAVTPAIAQRWLYNSTDPLHYTFNTPVGASAGDQCGEVLFSDFHVNNGDGFGDFPGECDTMPMTPQEKALEFMLFDLSSCVPPAGKM